MAMVEFNCPNCERTLQAPTYMDGETHECPYCDQPVTLQVVSAKDAIKAGIVACGLAALAAFFFGGDDY
jgi:DNA-directed RNA polymerase subunit RPC12/RpoP